MLACEDSRKRQTMHGRKKESRLNKMQDSGRKGMSGMSYAERLVGSFWKTYISCGAHWGFLSALVAATADIQPPSRSSQRLALTSHRSGH